MEGAENFDFFRQPDFVKDPFLKGSYAVYKKETLIGEGTGKLCHIHRPRIIDSRGRRVWGELSVMGNNLYITIPEAWLSEAKYPVVVDPTIGTTTVGSQYLWDNNDPGEPLTPLFFDCLMPVNRFLVSQGISGNCTAFAYTDRNDGSAGGRPVFYSDNGDKPWQRKSGAEGVFDFKVSGSNPAGWRSAVFRPEGGIAAGSYIWFGVFVKYMWYPRFDWGAKCYQEAWEDDGVIPDAYPLYGNGQYYENFKLSMYFTYSSAQNFTRTLTQGVTLPDSRKLAGVYQRRVTQTETAGDRANQRAEYLRGLFIQAGSLAETGHEGEYYRAVEDRAGSTGVSLRHLFIFLRLATLSFVRDYLISRFLRSRDEIVLKSPVTRELELDSCL
jgi:hypothetical protein